jgi:hypothetical protein
MSIYADDRRSKPTHCAPIRIMTAPCRASFVLSDEVGASQHDRPIALARPPGRAGLRTATGRRPGIRTT